MGIKGLSYGCVELWGCRINMLRRGRGVLFYMSESV